MRYFLKNVYLKSQFYFAWPYNIIAIFLNPFYLIRKNLFFYIKSYSRYLSGKVLDFGCGSKPYKNIFDKCEQYVGCDIEVSGHSHDNEDIDFYYNGKTLPFNDQEFDWIFSSEVFEHIFNLEEILSELNRILVHGGGMLLTVPFVWNEHEAPYDYARYTHFGIMDLLQRKGFEIVEYKKSTLYIEALFQMLIEYVRMMFVRVSVNFYFTVCAQIMFIAPITILGLICARVFPSNRSFYCNNVIVCKKIDEI